MKNLDAVLLSGLGAALLSVLCTACTNDPADPDGGGGQGQGASTSDGGSSSDGGSGSEGGAGGSFDDLDWQTLITADWQLQPGTELTNDIHAITVDHDTFIGAIRPIAPTGTHHTVLALNDLDQGHIIYASGVGTNPIIFPDGVGLRVPAGQTVILQLHLFNPSPDVLTGTSGIEIVEIDPADVESEADLYLPGPLDFAIPPNQEYTHSGTCTIAATQNVFAIFPHMHQAGAHFKSTLTASGEDIVIHDDDYSFDHQAFIAFDPITLNPGDKIKTECTWDNTTDQTIMWGQSSTAEMCFSILYRWPTQDDGGICTE